jgi:hypothetical protein
MKILLDKMHLELSQEVTDQCTAKKIGSAAYMRRRPEIHDNILFDEKCVINHIIQSQIRRSFPPTQAHQVMWGGINGSGAMVQKPKNGPQHQRRGLKP